MTRKIIGLVCLAVIALFAGISIFHPNSAYADDICASRTVSNEIKRASGCPGSGSETQIDSVIVNIINAVIAISGLVAVVYIIIGGVGYMTSAGDPGKVEKAKKTILYAVIGMAVCVLSFAIVNWAIRAISGNGVEAGSYATEDACTENGFKWDKDEGKCQEK